MDVFQRIDEAAEKFSEKLDLSGCKFDSIPSSVVKLAPHLKILNVVDCPNLSCLPKEFEQLDSLRIIFFLRCGFKAIPPEIARLKNLFMIGFKSNVLEVIPDDAFPVSLRWLILTDNKLKSLPSSIGKLKNLRKLMLTSNQLEYLPNSIGELQNLELVRLSNNNLSSVPRSLFALPKLSWIALAGNPLLKRRSMPNELVNFGNVSQDKFLGQGASGNVYLGHYGTSTQDTHRVAIKIFKESSSDGLPIDEVLVALRCSHKYIINCVGAFVTPKLGILMEYLDGYTNLAAPPNFDTVSRDNYQDGISFSSEVGMEILCGIAQACRSLHEAKVIHGDLYAHNIMVDAKGRPKLGDFGASFFYDEDDLLLENVAGLNMEAIEVRAYGCLVEEIAERLSVTENSRESELQKKLFNLKDDCLQSNLEKRPKFAQICDIMSSLKESILLP